MLFAKFAQLMLAQFRTRGKGSQSCSRPQAYWNWDHPQEKHKTNIFQLLTSSYSQLYGAYCLSWTKVPMRWLVCRSVFPESHSAKPILYSSSPGESQANCLQGALQIAKRGSDGFSSQRVSFVNKQSIGPNFRAQRSTSEGQRLQRGRGWF